MVKSAGWPGRTPKSCGPLIRGVDGALGVSTTALAGSPLVPWEAVVRNTATATVTNDAGIDRLITRLLLK